MATFIKIASVTVGSGGASSIAFTSIPQTYTDLQIVCSVRNSSTYEHILIGLNGSTSNFTEKYITGYGTTIASGTYARYLGNVSREGYTANTFGSTNIVIPNYTSSKYKSVSAESVGENNSSTDYAVVITTNLWSVTDAITSIQLTNEGGATILENSTATLYGIKNS